MLNVPLSSTLPAGDLLLATVSITGPADGDDWDPGITFFSNTTCTLPFLGSSAYTSYDVISYNDGSRTTATMVAVEFNVAVKCMMVNVAGGNASYAVSVDDVHPSSAGTFGLLEDNAPTHANTTGENIAATAFDGPYTGVRLDVAS